MKRSAITVTTAAAIAVILLLVWRWWPPQVVSKPRPDARLEDVNRAAENAPSPPTTPTRNHEQKQKQEERAKTIFQAIEGTNVVMDFWGKVIDHNEQPINGAKIDYRYTTEHGNMAGVAWGRQRVHKGSTVSNQDGLFSITGVRGSGLSVEMLQKAGYEYTPHASHSYDYYGSSAAGKFTPDPNKPVLFMMVNNATVEPLVSYGGNFGKTLRVSGDSTPARWNLWKGQPDGNGELQIIFSREPAVLAHVGPPTTWSAKVEVIGGGISEARPDEAIYRAPEEGYAAVVDYPKTEQKRGVPARSFYVKTADGKYGRIQLHLYPGDEGPSVRCLIKVYMNPSGSRNLQAADTAQASAP